MANFDSLKEAEVENGQGSGIVLVKVGDMVQLLHPLSHRGMYKNGINFIDFKRYCTTKKLIGEHPIRIVGIGWKLGIEVYLFFNGGYKFDSRYFSTPS